MSGDDVPCFSIFHCLLLAYKFLTFMVHYSYHLFHRNDTEIAIVYYRSGYHPSHFPTEKQWSAYLMLEQSNAIKCPPISHHLCTLKRIQQVISIPNVLEMYVIASTI